MGHPLIVSEVAYPSSIIDPMSDQSGNSIPLATVIGLEKGVSCRLDQSEFLPMMFFYHRDKKKHFLYAAVVKVLCVSGCWRQPTLERAYQRDGIKDEDLKILLEHLHLAILSIGLLSYLNQYISF